MIHPDLKSLSAPVERNAKIIWFGFANAPVVYGVLTWFLTDGGSKQLGSGEFPTEAVYAAIILSIASGVVFPWVIAPRVAGPVKMAQSQTPERSPFDIKGSPLYERLGERDRNRADNLYGIQSARIVQWAGAESVAIYGFMALLLGATNLYGAWAFFLASIGLLVMLRPDFERDLEQL